MLRGFGLIMVLAGVSHADVNLLRNVPATIAVSSTVDNATIVPQHLVDGSLDTAWNSRTDDLVGAWIAVRLPHGVHVTAIKLTAGFTHVDKTRRQDYFVWNARIKQLRVTHDGKSTDVTLDVDNRGLQTIPIDGGGGDYKLEVLAIVPGARTTWREIAISELEVWGTPGAAAKPSKPVVVIGSLDAPPVTEAQCIHALFPDASLHALADGDAITAVKVVGLTKDTVACRVDHRAKDSTDTTSDIAAVTTQLAVAGTHVSETRTQDDAVETNPFALSPTENGLLVEHRQRSSDMGGGDVDSKFTLYRATAGGLLPVYSFESSDSVDEEEHGTECTLAAGKARTPVADLVLSCDEITSDWHNEDSSKRGRFERPFEKHLHWHGSAYSE